MEGSSGTSSLVFDKQNIPEEGLNIDVCKDPSNFFPGDCGFKLKGAIKVDGHLTKLREIAYFKGNISTAVILTCARCLNDFDFLVRSAIQVDFLQKNETPKEEDLELQPSDLDTYYYDREKIDISEPVRDQIVISIPIKPLCKAGCAGLCPHCGQDLNQKNCQCSDQHARDPRLAPLEKLKQIKENL